MKLKFAKSDLSVKFIKFFEKKEKIKSKLLNYCTNSEAYLLVYNLLSKMRWQQIVRFKSGHDFTTINLEFIVLGDGLGLGADGRSLELVLVLAAIGLIN